MVGVNKKPMKIKEVLDAYGGFVRYFGTTELMQNMVAYVDPKKPLQILACCGGGDQSLTFLGHCQKGTEVYAFDLNPAQLFVLACKAVYLEDTKLKVFDPTFDRISRLHLGRIRKLPRNVQKITKLVNLRGNKNIDLKEDFREKFGFEIDSGLFDFKPQSLHWVKDRRFMAAIRKQLHHLNFIREDVLYISDWFAKGSLDVIYLSDIPLHNAIPYYLERLNTLILRLKPGGLVMGNTEDLNELDRNPTIMEILLNYQDLFGLKLVGQRKKSLCLRRNQ